MTTQTNTQTQTHDFTAIRNADSLHGRLYAAVDDLKKGAATMTAILHDLFLTGHRGYIEHELRMAHDRAGHAKKAFMNSLKVFMATNAKQYATTMQGETLQVKQGALRWAPKQRQGKSEQTDKINSSAAQTDKINSSAQSGETEQETVKPLTVLALPKPVMMQFADLLEQMTDDEKRQAARLLLSSLPNSMILVDKPASVKGPRKPRQTKKAA